MHILIASSKAFAAFHPDDALLAAAINKAGHSCELVYWQDHPVKQGDNVLLRTVWDYYQHLERFKAWIEQAKAVGARVLNPPHIVEWNLDKQYLIDLDTHGHDVITTTVLDNVSQLHGVVLSCGTPECVVKPTVSANAHNTLRFRTDDIIEAANVAQRIIDEGSLPMVQPFLPEISTVGEWSLVGFDGVYSHSVLKTPKAGDFRVQDGHGGTVMAVEPPPQALDAALRLFEFLKLPYMRVDGVVHYGQFLLMELELIEPELFLRFAPDSPERMATAVIRAFDNEIDYGPAPRRNSDC